MGVAGVGKRRWGRRLTSSLGWEFHDADDFQRREDARRYPADRGRPGAAAGDAARAGRQARASRAAGVTCSGKQRTMATQRVERRLSAVLAADVVGYSRLVGIDEEGTLERLRSIRLELI